MGRARDVKGSKVSILQIGRKIMPIEHDKCVYITGNLEQQL